MCKPSNLPEDEAEMVAMKDSVLEKRNATEHRVDTARKNLQTGTLYGSLSLAFLVMSFSLTMPHLQSRRDALQCDSLCYGSMTSLRSALALVGSALMGRLSDSDTSFLARTIGGGSGRKACLYLGSMATIVGLTIGSTMYSLRGMWLALIPGALFQQNFSVLKAQLADYHEAMEAAAAAEASDSKNDKNAAGSRAGSVGKLGMSVGLAFMVGPLVGATFVTTYDGASILAIVLSLISAILVSKLPKASKSEQTAPAKSVDATAKSGIQKFLDVKVARSPRAMFIMTIRCCMAFAFHIFATIWTVSLKERFDFGPSDHGKFMSFIGLSYALSQGVVAKQVTKLMGPNGRVAVIQICCIALGAGRYFALQTKSLAAVYVMFAAIITALGVMNTIITADTSNIASSSEIGGLFGLLEAVESGAGMIGPLAGGMLALIDPIMAPLMAVVALYLLIFLIVTFGYQKFMLSDAKDAASKKVL